MTVEVTDLITPTFTQVDPVCEGATFTLPATSLNGITGTWSPAINNSATPAYAFTPDEGQCAEPATMTVEVPDLITPTITHVDRVCEGAPLTLPATSLNGITDSWSPAINNSATTAYTFTPDEGQCADPATITVEPTHRFTAPFTQVDPVCEGATFTLPATS